MNTETATVETYGLKFGANRISKKLTVYRMARPTEEFWSAWKADKTGMKNAGYSVFKRGKDFFVSVYENGKTASFAEYVDQEKAIFSAIKAEIENDLLGYDGRANDDDLEQALLIVRTAGDRYDFEALAAYLNNWESTVSDAEDSVFDDYFRAAENTEAASAEAIAVSESAAEAAAEEEEPLAYMTEDRQCGWTISVFRTMEEACGAIGGYEEEDRQNDCFTENFYSVEEVNGETSVYRIPGYQRLVGVASTLNYDNDEARSISLAIPELPEYATLSDIRAKAIDLARDVALEDDYYNEMSEDVVNVFADLDIDGQEIIVRVVFRSPTGFENMIDLTFQFDHEEAK